MIDRWLGTKRVAERLESAVSERQRAMLQVVVDHMSAEARLDADGLLAGQVDEPQYHLWGTGRDTGPKGREAVMAYYGALVDARRGVLEYDIERIVVDDDTVVTEGFIRAFQHGPVAAQFGYSVPDLDAHYLVTYRALVIWPFDREGRLLGEDGYGGVDPEAFEQVAEADLPAEYLDLFASAV